MNSPCRTILTRTMTASHSVLVFVLLFVESVRSADQWLKPCTSRGRMPYESHYPPLHIMNNLYAILNRQLILYYQPPIVAMRHTLLFRNSPYYSRTRKFCLTIFCNQPNESLSARTTTRSTTTIDTVTSGLVRSKNTCRLIINDISGYCAPSLNESPKYYTDLY